MSVPDTRTDLLRRIDGVPHVVLGPLLLAAVVPLERISGVPRRTLATVLVPFTAYGALVVAGTQQRATPTPSWLIPLGVAANVAAAVVGSLGVTRRASTPVGRVAAAGLAIGGIRMMLALLRPGSPRGT